MLFRSEEAGVAIELLDLGQLGRQQVAPGIKEPLQSRLDGLILGQLCLRVEHLTAARLADVAL